LTLTVGIGYFRRRRELMIRNSDDLSDEMEATLN